MKYLILNILFLLIFISPTHATTQVLDTMSGDSTQNAQQDGEKTNEPVIDANLDEKFDSLIVKYEKFITKIGYGSEFVGHLMITSGVMFVTFLLLFIVQRLGFRLKHKLNAIRDKHALYHDRFRYYARAVRYTGYFIISVFSIYTLSIVWGVTDAELSIGKWGRYFIGDILSIFIIILIAIGVWEFLNTMMERYMGSLDSVQSSRLLTVLPIIKNIIFVAFFILFSLVLLSQIGLNIMPLLAGAGVLGIAIGFGAQTMVKDFLTGFTIILEDLIQVGDVASLAGKTGLVERITIRKVQLRDLSGRVYTIPFSEISVVENWTKDFSFYSMDIGVAYRENTDEVIEYLREIDEDLRADDDFNQFILEPLEVLGVDAFADSAVVIKARIKTKPIKQWLVGREFNRRMKIKFDEMGIEIPFPHQTIYFGEDKEGHAPRAPIEIINRPDDNDQLSENSKNKKSAKKQKNDVGYDKDSKEAEKKDKQDKMK
jgi:small-conductance mechanosensitive channel